MPAVTVDNLLVLPRVAEPAPEGDRPVVKITTAPSGFEGEGFPVRRAPHPRGERRPRAVQGGRTESG